MDLAELHRLRVVLYHRCQLASPPRRALPSYAERHQGPAAMEAAVVRYLGVRALDARPSTVAKLELALRRFMGFLGEDAAEIDSWTAVTRDHALAFAAYLNQATGWRSGHPLRNGTPAQPLAAMTKRNYLCALSVFSTDVAGWGPGPTGRLARCSVRATCRRCRGGCRATSPRPS